MPSLQESAQSLMSLDGAVAFAVVDHTSGMTLTTVNAVPFDIELAAAVATEVVRAQMRAIDQLGGEQLVDDILITLSGQLHLVVMSRDPRFAGLFSYLVLDRERGNLALARHRLRAAAADVEL
ncbi:hypothetical protein [Cellulomonas sp. NPDC058312]|uniref:hypothetical protein n=1 Tax=Cellulomonas sp. NPDC058312 TaxID=3346441 RepID=UPI0036E00BEE